MKPHLFNLALGVMSDAECNDIASAVQASSGDNALSGAFRGSYGFQRVFRRDGIDALLGEKAFLRPFIQTSMIYDQCNAFYLNALIIAGGHEVQRHRDCSLNSWLGVDRAPVEVSVLYARVPSDLSGGELQLFDTGGHVLTCTPRQGALVRFAGHLGHGVKPVVTEASRISLVLEQYALSEEEARRAPRYSADADARLASERVRQKLGELARGLNQDELAALRALVGPGAA